MQLLVAFAACYSNTGYAPAPATKLPPHPRIAYYNDEHGTDFKFTATLDGKPVALKVTAIESAPYHLRILEVDSSKTGTLVIKGGRLAGDASYTITKDAALPDAIPVTIGRSLKEMQHTSVAEKFDALAIRLPEATPAITAHVKVRRDAKAAWTELDVPVVPNDFDDPRPTIRLGELGCTKNYTVDLLKQGVDIEATITLADGTTRPAKDLASHVTLPKPKQP